MSTLDTGKSWHSLAAGLIAGGVEGVATYPTEYIKTQAQLARQRDHSDGHAAHSSISRPQIPSLQRRSAHSITFSQLAFATKVSFSSKKHAVAAPNSSPMQIIVSTYRLRGLQGFYAGCAPMATGNALKAGTRFLVYDRIKEALRSEQGQLTLPRSVLAGLLAGIAEGALAVTPSEAIKTRMIQDAAGQPKYKSAWHGISSIVRTEGISSLYRGLTATVVRQGANSAVRLSSYSALRSSYETYMGAKMGVGATFCAGAIAGTITVYATMPFDVVKTRMQSANAQQYGIASCAVNVVRTEGFSRLWAGTGPRLTRLIFSGGIAFSVYESVMKALQ